MIRGHSQNVQKFAPFYHWLDIQLGTISPLNQDWISRQSMPASKMHFWKLSIIKWCKRLYILRMAWDHVLGCNWGHTWLIWMKFAENVGMIPIKICNFLQFLFTWTNEPQIDIQIVWKLKVHPVYQSCGTIKLVVGLSKVFWRLASFILSLMICLRSVFILSKI